MTRRRILLVRHGDVRYFNAAGQPVNPHTVALSAEGRRQVDSLAAALAAVPIDRAVSSTVPRAIETAERLIHDRAIPLASTDELREIRGGRLSAVPPGALADTLARGYRCAAAPGARWLEGESFVAFRARILAGLGAILAAPDWDSLLLVAHDAVNRVMLAWACGGGLELLPAFEQDYACLNVIDLDHVEGSDPACYLRLVNATPYDPVKASTRHTVLERLFADYRPPG